MKKVSVMYWILVLWLGICIGYYVIPYFTKPSTQYILDQGFTYGAIYYKDRISRMGTFESISDSCVAIYIGYDTIMVYK